MFQLFRGGGASKSNGLDENGHYTLVLVRHGEKQIYHFKKM
jgi:hypothetical protein